MASKKSNPYLKEKVKAIEVGKKTVSELLKAMSQTGFQGRKLGDLAKTWETMIKDKDLTILMGYAASLSTTGQWKIINWLIENRFIDVLVGTGANLSEDIVEAMGNSYWKGSHNVDDVDLLGSDINRYYDVFGREADYMDMTEMIAEFYIKNLKPDYPYSSREIFSLFGKWLWKKGIKSIVATATHYGVPVFCPAIVDSPYGDAGLIVHSQGFNLMIDNMKDYTEFMGLGQGIKDSGVIYIGGGVPKDFIQLLAVTADLLYPDRTIPGRKFETLKIERKKGKDHVVETYYPHKYALQITTDAPQWGGLSGCTFEEATSWGKEKVGAPKVQCFCDATIALPLVSHALFENVKTKRKGTDFSHLFK